MNLSLRNRVAACFIIANIVVLVLGFSVFDFLDSLNKEIESITLESNRITLLTDEIRISAVSILKYQRRLLTSPELINPKKNFSPGNNKNLQQNTGSNQFDLQQQNSRIEVTEKLINLCDSFTFQLQNLDAIYTGVEIKQVIAKMLGYVDSLKLILKKSSERGRENMALESIGDLADKILEAFSEFQDIQFFQNQERDKTIKNTVRKTKKNMMATLIITFVGTVLLGLVVPGKIALPFKKINDTIRELQDCNFDVSIFYNQDDEIGEMAEEMNKMIGNLKKFEELRADRINTESRKFDALANTVKKHVLVANAKGELMYLNGQLYSLLQISSDDVLFKSMKDSLIPQSIVDAIFLAIKRRSKIENATIEIKSRKKEIVDFLDTDTDGFDPKLVQDFHDKPEKEEIIFVGHANIIPIRGKESSLDYYLMVMSEEIFS